MNFVTELARATEMETIMEPAEPSTWNPFMDGSSGEAGSGTGIVLENLERHKFNCTIRFDFKASNNVAKYEALLAGLSLAREMQVKRLFASSDSHMIVSK